MTPLHDDALTVTHAADGTEDPAHVMSLEALGRDVVGIEIEQPFALLHSPQVPVPDAHPVTPCAPGRR
jgi:hypothetical protein